MASAYLFATSVNPQGPDGVTTATTGGTITGASGVVELVFDDTVFTRKKDLVLAVEAILNKLRQTGTDFPLA